MVRLRAKAAAAEESSSVSASTFTEGETEPIQLCIHNKTDCTIDVNWVDYSGELQKYSTVHPDGSYCLSSFSTHPWALTYGDGHHVTYVGSSALLVLLPKGKLQVKPYQHAADDDDSSWQDPAWGQYEQRGSVLGMPIMAWQCVCAEAVQQAEHVVQHMLAGCPAGVLERMVAAGCNIAIIGRHQVTTDIPAHHFMKSRSGVEGARDIDGTTRGLGATAAVPTTSCGEENLTMVDDRKYCNENILIHELGHAVMTLGLDKQQLQRVHQCYSNSADKGLYDSKCYMMENADEYFAEGCQTWFDATARSDVNSGINTREKLKAHDPGFAELLAEVFGDGSWRYPQTAPAPFKGSKHKAGHQGEQSRSVVAALPAVAAAQSAAHHRPQTRSLTAAAAAASAAAAADTPNRRSKGKQRQLKIKMPSVTHKRAPTSLRRSAGQGRGVVKQRSRQPKQRGSA